METWWNDIGSPKLTPELRDKVAEGVAEELAQTPLPAMTQARDAILMELIRRKAESDKLP
jgi:hypothetical protein